MKHLYLSILSALVFTGCGDPRTETAKAPTPPPEPTKPAVPPVAPQPAPQPKPPSTPVKAEPVQPKKNLDAELAVYTVPPAWVATTSIDYDTNKPWKEARQEIRRLLGLNRPDTHRQAMKLTWLYLQKNDINDGHEYPMYTFMGGEPLWAVKAANWYVNKPDSKAPVHAFLYLASIYTQYGEYERAIKTLTLALTKLPDPPMNVMRQADIHDAFGDVLVASGKIDLAKKNYEQSVRMYPTAKPKYGRHLLPRRARKVQAKLDLLNYRPLDSATLKDGRYTDKALGYSGDINLTVIVKGGRVADIKTSHKEKIDQGACVSVPKNVIARQSLQVDSVSGATVTKDAIIAGTYRALKKAGL
jgi:uncharacterized protein with FMN-binding domain